MKREATEVSRRGAATEVNGREEVTEVSGRGEATEMSGRGEATGVRGEVTEETAEESEARRGTDEIEVETEEGIRAEDMGGTRAGQDSTTTSRTGRIDQVGTEYTMCSGS